jgi:hypothetical protein
MKMPSLRNLTFATATLGTLGACVPTTQNQTPLTPRQAERQTTALVGAGGAILCGLIDDRNTRTACFAAAAAAAVAAGTQANANAAAEGYCDRIVTLEGKTVSGDRSRCPQRNPFPAGI